MQYTGARILIESLIEQGVDTVFGYPGGAVLFIYDELYKHRDRIRHVLTSHEQHAAHAADGYARSTGKVGVCLATSGPGATNLVTGIATAYMDSVPIVAITGNVATSLLGKDSFQEVDIAGVTMPITKHNWIVKDVRDLAEVIREAFIVAASGRPGPVLIDIPKDVTAALCEWTPRSQHVPEEHQSPVALARAARLSARAKRPTFSDEDIAAAVHLITQAKRPFVYAGGGVHIADASAELKTFVERLKAPVALSLMGKGAIPHDHPLNTGMIGMHGSVASNKAIQRADLVIAIGARFSDRVVSRADKFAPNAKILHIDIDPAEINKNVRSEQWIIGDVKVVLQQLLEKLPERMESEWNGDVAELKKIVPEAHSRPVPLHPRFIMEQVARRLGPEAIVATDVGQHQMWAAQFYPINRSRAFLTSGGLGTMGCGMGLALGAKRAHPTRPVVLFTGDGSFRMNCGELATSANYHLPILVVILNNRVLGMVRQWQALFYDERYAETTLDRPPDFVKLAEAYSAVGYRAEDERSFVEALEKALSHIAGGHTAVIEAIIDMDEQVLPMVPGGKAIDEQIL
ncbi:MAG: biosynthetic-type acetolactate synthase large subunit [Treponemataceae bacterium]|nr:biosynthetic-type acetolactate synthase large subunit [Treponemataceae bacterium]